MEKIIKIAWRNVWRNKLRSLVVITSMVLGLWSGLFTIAMSNGINEQRVKSAIDTYLHHIQIHNPLFEYNLDINSYVEDPLQIVKELENNNLVKGFSSRIIISAMASSAHGAEGVRIIGIDSENEKQFSDISKNIIEFLISSCNNLSAFKKGTSSL